MTRKEFTADDILALEQRYRANFINSLGGFKSLALIGTLSATGQSNLAPFNSFFHVGANPPLFGFIVRPDSVERHTLNNILETNVFTVNHVHESFFKAAHQASARYPQNVSEFDAVGLKEEYIPKHHAPFVAESHIKIGARLCEKTDIKLNETILIVAAITYVSIPADIVMADGFVDIEKAGTITCAGLDSYHTTRRIARLSYAKTGSTPGEI